MSKILTVAWREFTQTVMRKIFIIAVLGMPVVFIGIVVAAAILMEGNEQPNLIGTVADRYRRSAAYLRWQAQALDLAF